MSEQPLFDLFVPMDRRQALSRDDSLPIQSTGSVLLADISGFTPLTLALADDFGQQRGAELLTRHLNQLFTQLIARIHDFCGSVIGFNGDGLTCWFPDDDGYRAATVALAIQAIVGEAGKVQTPTGKTYALGIKVAVTAGVVRRFLVGDPGIRYIEAMAGLELDRVAAGEQAIQSGEVALGNEVVEALAGRAVISGMRPAATGEIFALLSDLTEPAEPNPWPEIPLLDREKSRDWILPHVHKRLLEEQSDFLTEFRQAVPLFFKFTGLDFVNDGLVGEKLDLLVRRFQTIMRKYDGILNDLTIGDKGSYIIGVFGAPQAHEDDVTHGVLAALEVMAEVANLDFIESAQIGLALGRIRAGTFGGDLQLTYGIQGTEANLAARLMAAAEPGQILTSPKVANAADGIAFEKLAAVQLKGLPEAMHPHRVVGRTQVQAVQALTPLFGRDKELELISRKLDQHGPEAQISIVVEGEAGIGKSRLLAELLEQSRQRGFLTLSSAGDSVEQTTPYFGWRPILMGILGIKANDDVSQQQDDVYTMLGDNLFLSERLSLLNDVLPLEFKPNALTDQMTGEARSNSIRDVMLGLRERWFASRSAMDAAAVLVFDDAQWIDTATWQLIGQIAGRRPGLLVVIGARPLESSAAGSLIQKELERLIQQPLASYIKLQSLSRNESTALAAKLLGVPTLPLSIEEMIHSRSQGNPFLSAEIAYALRDTAAHADYR